MAVHGPLKLRRSALVAAALAAGLATPSPASATGPGRNGAFVFGGVGQLVKVMPGSPPVNITPDNDEDDYFDVAVSFDGQRIAATKSGDGNRMITSKLDRSDLHEFTAGRFPSFLPDGRVISDDQTPNYESEIYATAPDGSGRVRLSYDSDPGYFKYNPVASPDGRSVYFYDSGRAVNSDGYRIRKVDLATGAVSLVLSSGQTSAIALADISPDGRHVLLTRFRGAAAPYDLVVRSLQDGSEKVVTQAAAYGDAVFSPDGTTVAYITANGLDIRGVGLDGDNDRLLFALRESDEDGFVKMNNLNWQPIVASDLVVNRTGDEEDDDTDDGLCDVDPAVAGLQCTLRAAIQEANASAASALVPAKIRFELEAGATPTISPGSPLPALEKPVQLDGRTGATKVRLDGGAAGSTASGLRLQGGTSLVHDLAVTRFARDGIVIDGGSGTVIGGSDLGALPDGSCGDPCALGNGRSGVRITGGAVKSRVGDPMALNSTERVQASLDAIRNDTYFPSQNVIAHNGDDAVTIISGRENDVAGNRMYANADLAIDLLGDGISANDPRDLDTGPNDLINAPAATSSSARPISGQSRYQRVGQALYVGTPDRPLRLVSYALDGCDAPFSEQADRIGSDGDFLTDAVGRSEPTGTADRSALPEASTSLAFAVVDRQGNTSEVSNCSIDEDGDAIDDGFEREGADLDRDGTAEVPLDRLGAVVGKHDVFVEVDWTRGHALDREALERVQQAYAGSPHLNPDGSTGVRLHIDTGPGSPLLDGGSWGGQGHGSEVRTPHEFLLDGGGDGRWANFDEVKQAEFDVVRRPFFRYVLSVRQLDAADPETLGEARAVSATLAGVTSGTDMGLGLGAFCEPAGTDCPGPVDAQAGGFMHELGHLLGLKHGGTDEQLLKPNFFSVMNYLYVTGTLLPSELPDSASVPILDYSQTGPNGGPKGTVADLDEENLIEANGITASGEAAGFSALQGCEAGASGEQTRFDLIPKMNAPVDWDCDGPTAQTYEFDLNNSGQKGPLTTVPEWDRLKFAGGSVGGKFEVTGATLEPNEPLPAGILKATVPVLIGDSAAPSVTIETVGHTETAATLRVRAADDHQLDSVALTVDGEPRTIRATGPVTGNGSANVKAVEDLVQLGPGEHVVTALAFDRALHSSARVERSLRVGPRSSPGDPVPAPAPPAPASPAPPGAGPPAPPPSFATLVAPVREVPGTSRSARIRVPIACSPGSGSCRGTVGARTSRALRDPARRSAKARRVTLRARSFTLAPGRQAEISLTLPRAARQELARRRRLTLSITVAQTAPSRVSRTARVTVVLVPAAVRASRSGRVKVTVADSPDLPATEKVRYELRERGGAHRRLAVSIQRPRPGRVRTVTLRLTAGARARLARRRTQSVELRVGRVTSDATATYQRQTLTLRTGTGR